MLVFLQRLNSKVARKANLLKPQQKHRFYVFILFSLLFIPVFIGFSIYHFPRDKYLLAIIDLCLAVLVIISLVSVFYIQKKEMVYFIDFGLVFIFVSYFFIMGFEDGTSAHWMYSIPLITMFLFGRKISLFVVTISYFVIVITFINPDIINIPFYNYPQYMKIRFLVTYSSIVLMSYIYESIRNKFQENLERSREELLAEKNELKKALKNVKILTGLLPICSHCKKVRDDEGYWHLVETYIEKHSEAFFSHGICPNCIKKLHPDLAEDIIKDMNENDS